MRKITNELIQKFKEYLIDEEKSSSTLEKYIRDIKVFMEWCKETELNKSIVLEYKQDIVEKYAPASVNSILSSLNSFFAYNEWYDLKVKALKIQKQIFSSRGDKNVSSNYYNSCDCSSCCENIKQQQSKQQNKYTYGIRKSR